MSYYDLKITGKDVKRFLQNLYKMHIEFLNITFLEHGAIVKVSEKDYQKIKKIKTIYEIEVVKLYGFASLQAFLKKYALFFLFLGIGFVLFLGLTNIIFEVEVIHNDKELRELILEELKKEGIKKYHFVVSYQKKEEIKEKILSQYKNKIEWLEIERQGTRYEIKVEERKLNQEKTEETPKNLVAKKNGIIQKITATQGEILVKKDQYVKKGDILIGGTIHNKEVEVGKVRAEGSVLAETWYTVSIEFPYHYHEETKTGVKQTYLEFNWFHHPIKFFSFHSYPNSIQESLYVLKNPILPISFSLIREEKVNVIDQIYTKENAIIEASNLAKRRLQERIGENIEILFEKNLKITEEDSKIEVVMFYKVLEEITELQEILEENSQEEQGNQVIE